LSGINVIDDNDIIDNDIIDNNIIDNDIIVNDIIDNVVDNVEIKIMLIIINIYYYLNMISVPRGTSTTPHESGPKLWVSTPRKKRGGREERKRKEKKRRKRKEREEKREFSCSMHIRSLFYSFQIIVLFI